MSIQTVYTEARASAQVRDTGPVGVEVLVVTGFVPGAMSEETARRAAPMVASTLYPHRLFGRVLHLEPAGYASGAYHVVVEDMGVKA